MTIRHATPADRDAILAMGLRFMRESHYQQFVSAVSIPGVTALIDGFLATATGKPDAGGVALVAEDDGALFGMLGMLACPHPVSGQLYGDELCWWVDPAQRGATLAGLQLFAHAEAWAKARGLAFIKMVAPANVPIVGRFYLRSGYTPVETAYVKVMA